MAAHRAPRVPRRRRAAAFLTSLTAGPVLTTVAALAGWL